MAETTIPENPAAFPDSVSVDHMDGLNFSRNKGMTLRDYFAAKAMLVAFKYWSETYPAKDPDGEFSINSDAHLDDVAIDAYAMADAMLKAREA